jgi:hypothetical protein
MESGTCKSAICYCWKVENYACLLFVDSVKPRIALCKLSEEKILAWGGSKGFGIRGSAEPPK